MSVMGSQTTLTTTAARNEPVRDWNFNTTSQSPFWSAGLAAEYQPGQNWTLTAELMYSQLKYTKYTAVSWGTDDPSTTVDERTHMFFTEATKANLFDVPVMLHHRGLRSSGPLSKVWFGFGAAGRSISSIRTSLTTENTDATTAVTSVPVRPSRRTLVGGVVGIGFRVVDDFNINWTPEIRFTRWAGSTFGSDSTVSPRNQLEVGLGITF